MSLAEQIGRDIRSVFLNTNDFARPRNWNGQTVTVVEDRDRLQEIKAKRDDLREADKLVYISAEDCGKLPSPGAFVTYEDRRYRITDATDEEGMYMILLTEVRR